MSPPRRRRPRRPGDAALKRIAFAWLAGVALVAALAGCGGGKKETTKPTYVAAKVYFLYHGKVQPIRRFVEADEPLRGVWESLTAGPTAEAAMGASTALPIERGETVFRSSALSRTSEGLPSLHTTAKLPHVFVAQAVYTLSQFAPARPVIVNGKRYTRKDFEDETPAILVESPLPEQMIRSPLRVTGTANTFEATFQYDLVGPDGKVVASHFATATSGSGTRGTFDFTVPYKVARFGVGKLVVYESSAKDGSRIHVVEIPIRMTR